jgi:hypothetical protein
MSEPWYFGWVGCWWEECGACNISLFLNYLCRSSSWLIGNKWAPQYLCIIPSWSVQEYEWTVIFRLGRLLVGGARACNISLIFNDLCRSSSRPVCNKWAPQFVNSQLICAGVWASCDISAGSAAGGRSVGPQYLLTFQWSVYKFMRASRQ